MAYAIITVVRPAPFLENGRPAPIYALCFFVGGTSFLCLGMFLCARLVEKATVETTFSVPNPMAAKSFGHSQIYWIQPGGQKVGEQVFRTFVGARPVSDKNCNYIRSRRAGSRENTSSVGLLWLSVAMVMLSFVAQFIGYRSLHSSITIAQLGSTLVMAFARSMLRAKRLGPKENLLRDDKISLGHELDWFAMKLQGIERFEIFEREDWPSNSSKTDREDGDTSFQAADLPLPLVTCRVCH